jgi:hypothetical protein
MQESIPRRKELTVRADDLRVAPSLEDIKRTPVTRYRVWAW